MNLYAGKLLIIDLSEKTIETEPVRKEWLRDYWGGWGLGVRYFWEAVSPQVDPLSPQEKRHKLGSELLKTVRVIKG